MGIVRPTPAAPRVASAAMTHHHRGSRAAPLLIATLFLFVGVELWTHLSRPLPSTAPIRQAAVDFYFVDKTRNGGLHLKGLLSQPTPTPLPPTLTATSANTKSNVKPPVAPTTTTPPVSSPAAPIFTIHDPISQSARDALSPDASANYRYTNGRLVRFFDTVGLRALHQANETARALNNVHVAVDDAPSTPSSLQGPLCVFVPANVQDELHRSELEAAMSSWMDKSTVIFTEANLSASLSLRVARAVMAEWNALHQDTISEQPRLKTRVRSVRQLKGRGQLSIPLFHWISQLVKRNDPLVQNCKWFMKCDTDTYLRRGLLEREVLNKLDHTKPYHVGVPLNFNTRPYHQTERKIEFKYNIGGPGYTFSRALMDAVDVDACVRSMTLDPVLLIHDDVATGYCATYHAGVTASRVEIRTAISSSSSNFVQHWLTDNSSTSAQEHESSAVHLRGSHCLSAFASAHPVTPTLVELLHHFDQSGTNYGIDATCSMTMIVGAPAQIGSGWPLDADLSELIRNWDLLWREKREQVGTNVARIQSLQKKFFL